VATATITSKGQITLPKAVRTKLGLEAGHRVELSRQRPASSSNPPRGMFDCSRALYRGRAKR